MTVAFICSNNDNVFISLIILRPPIPVMGGRVEVGDGLIIEVTLDIIQALLISDYHHNLS